MGSQSLHFKGTLLIMSCTICDKPASSDSTEVKGKLFHDSCYKAAFGTLPKQNHIDNTEACFICSKPVVSGEKVVQGGREAHRECFDSRKTETVVTSNLSTAEQCPLCQKTVDVQGEVKIIAG